MMAQTEERLVELINLASVEGDGNKKVEYLYQIRELALNHGLLKNFFQDILAFQNERAPNVKKFVLAFIESACKIDCQLCPVAILSLNLLLNDTNTEVIKRSIQAASQFYRALVKWLSGGSGGGAGGGSGELSSRGRSSGASTGTRSSTNTNASNNNNNNNSNLTAPQTTIEVKCSNDQSVEQSPLSPQQTYPNFQHQAPHSNQQNLIINNDLMTTELSLEQPTITNSTTTQQLSSDDVEKTWLLWLQTKKFICNLLETTNNDGVRTQCIKFIETIVLMQTPRDKYTDPSYEINLIDPVIAPIQLSNEAAASGVHGLPRNGVLFNEEHKLELVEAAKKRFEQLVIFHGTSHVSSVNLMAAMQTLVVLAKQRYRLFMGRVIQAMESLHNRLPPTLTESQVQSVKKFLKLQLTVMLKHPYSLDRFQLQITQLLQAVGSKQPEIHKVINDFKNKFGCDTPIINNNVNPEILKRIKLEPGLNKQQLPTLIGTQSLPVGKSKHLDLNKLTQELDEKEKRQIVVDSVKRILGEEKRVYIPPAQMEIKKKVLSTLSNEFHNTECPKIIQDYIFGDLRNRHEICYAIIRKNYDVAVAKAAKRQINLFDNQELLKNYFDCFNSYLNRAMDLKDTKDRDIILPKLYALREEYYSITNQDQEQDDK